MLDMALTNVCSSLGGGTNLVYIDYSSDTHYTLGDGTQEQKFRNFISAIIDGFCGRSSL